VWLRKAQKSKKQSPVTAQVSPVGNVQPVLLWPNIGTATWDKGWTSEKRGRYSNQVTTALPAKPYGKD